MSAFLRKRYAADLALLGTAIVWGCAFVAQRTAMEHVGPLFFNGIRFLLAALVLGLCIRRFWPTALFTRSVAVPGAIIGTVLFVSASLQQIGIVSTSAAKAGFITGLYILFIPLLLRVWKGTSTRAQDWAGIFTAIWGLFLLTAVESIFTLSAGDSLVLLSAAGFAVQVVLVGELVQRHSSLALAFWQFLSVAVLSLLSAVIFEQPSLGALNEIGLEIAYTGVISICFGYTMQTVAQEYTSSVKAGLILSFEAVFAALGGWFLLHESLSGTQLVGCGLMFLGVILPQIPSSTKVRESVSKEVP